MCGFLAQLVHFQFLMRAGCRSASICLRRVPCMQCGTKRSRPMSGCYSSTLTLLHAANSSAEAIGTDATLIEVDGELTDQPLRAWYTSEYR